MDLGLNEQQKILQKTARDFLVKECPAPLVRKMVDGEEGYSRDLWQKMAGLGWMGLIYPGEYGGAGGSLIDLVVLMEEMGRACLPSPFFSSIILGGRTILEAGSLDQKRAFLPRVVSGELIGTLALLESTDEYSPNGIAAKAIIDYDGYRLSGTKLFVSDAHVADFMICIAKTIQASEKIEDITLFLVDPKSPEVKCTLLKTTAGDKQYEVSFKKTRVPKQNILGQEGRGWPNMLRVLRFATVAKCAEMVGAAQKVLEMTVEHAKHRIQYDKPIGSFQAIQHHCANMAMAVDASRLLTYQAAWRFSAGLPCNEDVSAAKSWTSDAYERVVALGHQVHGAVSVTQDHDMPLYYSRAMGFRNAFGNSEFHRAIVSGELGLT